MQGIRFRDGAKIECQEHVYAEHFLPVGEGEVDLTAFFVRLDLFSGAREAAVQQVEDLGEAGRLRGGELERQGRQLEIVDEEAARVDCRVLPEIQVELHLRLDLLGDYIGIGLDGGG